VRSQALSGIHTNPNGPVRSQECTYNFTGLLVCSQGCNRTQTPNQDTPHNLSPPPGFHVFILHILQETTRPSVCASQVRGSTLRCLCSLVAYLCHDTLCHDNVSRHVTSPDAFDWLPLCARQASRGSPLPRIFMDLGGMKAAFVPPLRTTFLPVTLPSVAPR